MKAKLNKFFISLDRFLPPDWYGLVQRYQVDYAGYSGGSWNNHFFYSEAKKEYDRNKESAVRVTLKKDYKELETTLNKPEKGSGNEMVMFEGRLMSKYQMEEIIKELNCTKNS